MDATDFKPRRKRLEALLHGSRLPVLKKVVDALRAQLSGRRGLTQHMSLTLLCLRYRSTRPISSAIADYINVPRQTMTSAIDALERCGYAFRRAGRGDRRSKTLVLTPLGADMADKIGAGLLEFERKIWSVFTADELAVIDGYGRRLSEQIALVTKEERDSRREKGAAR